ncbi:hypothetical protein HMPREF9554_01290 [Treponema phagedenis F0421]|nr:hypothetical protein HMPREF9554_01290 [Treponema phagedenis F0421]
MRLQHSYGNRPPMTHSEQARTPVAPSRNEFEGKTVYILPMVSLLAVAPCRALFINLLYDSVKVFKICYNP